MADFDVAVIGSGLYGLMTALKMETAGARVLLIDRYAPGHSAAASSGLTRAAHSLYDDTVYRNLAELSLQAYRHMDKDFIAPCEAVLFAEHKDKTTHAQKVIASASPHHTKLSQTETAKRYPDFSAGYACVDTHAGIFRVARVRHSLLEQLNLSSVICAFQTDPIGIGRDGMISCKDGRVFQADKILIAAGAGSQGVVDLCAGVKLDLGLKLTKPGTLLHLKPRNVAQAAKASSRHMPAFAYIERGVFGLPIVEGYSDCVKIAGYYDPQAREMTGEDPLSFLETHAPFLLDFDRCEPEVIDGCVYDYTQDGHFILGPLSERDNIFVACGWNGGGYKFAPAVTDLIISMLKGHTAPVPEIFSPARLVNKIGCGGRI